MNIGFYCRHFDARGTGDALFNYAHFNETLLHNRSYIFCKVPFLYPEHNDQTCIARFMNRWKVYFYQTKQQLEEYCSLMKIHALYTILSGKTSDQPFISFELPSTVPLLVHTVFSNDCLLGNIQASISPTVPRNKLSDISKVATVPHIVHLHSTTEDLRQHLGIPDSALVLGRHGGVDCFDIPYVVPAIFSVLKQRQDIYFLFMNKPNSMSRANIHHPRIIYLSASADLEERTKFINTCDAMLHAKAIGESFGLAVLEFATRNKPVLTTAATHPYPIGQNHHLDVLQDKAINYNNMTTLVELMLKLDKKEIAKQNWLPSRLFAPAEVMQEFRAVFLDPLNVAAQEPKPVFPSVVKDQHRSETQHCAKLE